MTSKETTTVPHPLRRLVAAAALAVAATLSLTGCDSGAGYTGTATITDLYHRNGYFMTSGKAKIWKPTKWTARVCATAEDGAEKCWKDTIDEALYEQATVGDQVHVLDGQIEHLMEPA